MNVRFEVLACALILAPAAAGAQVLTGTTEWTLTRGTNASDGVSAPNDSSSQLYTVGFSAPFLDPRLMKYNTDVSLRTNALGFGSGQEFTEGHQRDLGYRVGASLFPSRPFPLYFQISRDVTGESGDYPTTSGLRGGIVVPADTPAPAFSTVTRALVAGGQLNLPKQVRLELNYRSGSSEMTGGPFAAATTTTDLRFAAFKETGRTHQTLRFQQNAYGSALSQSFDQRATDLDYEFSALVGARTRLLVHSGQRRSYSLFDLPQTVVDGGKAQYTLSRSGDARTRYVTTGISWEPATRLSFDLTGGMDQQEADALTLSSRLATTSARLEVFRGLSLNLIGVYGDRGQVFNDQPITVITKSGAAGASFRRGPRWLEGTLSATRGIGLNTTPDGRTGQVHQLSGQAYLTSSWRWMSVSGGYDRQRGEDGVLDLGNFTLERRQVFLQQGLGRWSIMGNAEDTTTNRGVGASLSQIRQRTLSGTATITLRRDMRVGANAGGFDTETGVSRDRTFFYGATWDALLQRTVRLSAWMRREQLDATQSAILQENLFWFGSIEYRLRLFLFACELRNNDQQLRYAGSIDPFRYSGRQVRLRISRKLGMRL